MTALTVPTAPAPSPETLDPRFAALLDFVLRWECAYDPRTGAVIAENVAGDSGGLTKYGIDARSHPGVDIPNLTRAGAAEIYYRRYYVGSRASELPDGLSDAHFDASVNVGAARATKLLQEALALRVDGVFGPVTLAAAYRSAPAPAVHRLLTARADFYRDLGARTTAHRFLGGWLNRVAALRRFISERTGFDFKN